jgi:hypothetical protein
MNRIVALWVSLSATILISTSTHASLRYSFSPTADGLRYILIEGEFEFGDDVSKLDRDIRTFHPQAVTFHSIGGNVAKAMEVGRLIRSFGLNTFQARGLECASACALAFFGGVSRIAEPGSIGMHKSSFSDGAGLNVAEAVSAVQEMTADIVTYMVEMGVDPALLQVALKYDSDDMRYLSKGEMVHYKVVTEFPRTEELSREPDRSPVPAPTAPEPAPVAVSGRKVPVYPITGDNRRIAWVYINVCSGTLTREQGLREVIDNRKFASMRMVAGQIAYFDPMRTPECAEANVLKTYTHWRTRSQQTPIVAAAAELWALLLPYGIRIDGKLGTLSGDADDDFRFDIWLTNLPNLNTLPLRDLDRFSIPQALSGIIRHPGGRAKLKAAPNGTSADVRYLGNGTPVSINGDADGWYRVSALGLTGFMHHSWIRVDQFENAGYDDRYVQIVSFDNYEDAEAYVKSSKKPLAVHLVSNGWYAVTLSRTYKPVEAKRLADSLKRNGDIPKDAFATYGNTYVRQVCCEAY